jgi:exodeoxyribonuclease V alpha subunit
MGLWDALDLEGVEIRASEPNLEEREVRGRVEVMYYSDPKFSAGKLVTDSRRSIRFKGPLVAQGDAVVLRGAWDYTEKYGWQFEAASFYFDQAMSVVGLAQYLENHPDMVGIGPAKARLIAETFRGDFDRVIDEQPERVVQVAKLSPESVKRLREQWLSKRNSNASLMWLASLGFTHHQSALLIEKYDNSVVTVLKGDPYSIVAKYPLRQVTDKIAREKFSIAADDPRRIRGAVLYCIADRRNDKGDCFVEYETLLDITQGDGVLEAEVPDLVVRACHELVEAEKLVRLVFDNKRVIADPFLYQQECDLADVFSRCGENTKQISVEGMDEDLNEGQQSAVFAALQYNLLVLTGGAGSGKTFTIADIVKLYERAGLHVVLTAPTGKAARRMEELVGRSAQTIHRLLKYNGRVFSEEKIPADVVIVDEVSMVDVPLAWHLFRAIDFSKTNVILVGDHNQLPPIGPGNVLRDLVARRPIPTVVLETIMRQASAKENANAILRGGAADFRAGGRPDGLGRRGRARVQGPPRRPALHLRLVRDVLGRGLRIRPVGGRPVVDA